MPADPRRDAETGGRESVPTNNATSRRRLLSSAAAGSVTALAGCAELLGSADALSVCVWSGNYADRFEEGAAAPFEEEHDVELDVQRGWNEILTDIRNAPEDDPPYDVTVAEGYFYYYGRQDDLFEPIREENVPNTDEIIDYYAEMRDTEYGLPVDGAPCTIVHREDADVDPESWGDLSSDAVQNSAGVGVDTGFWWYPLYATAIGMDAAEGAEEMHDESQHDAVLDAFESWNVASWASSGEDIWQAFGDGVIDVAQWYYDQTAFDIDDYDGLTHTLPDQTTGWFNNWCVVKGTDRRDEAEQFINFLLDGDVQSEWAQVHPMVFSNENIEYADELEADLPTTTEEAESIAYPDWEYLSDYTDDLESAVTSMQQNT